MKRDTTPKSASGKLLRHAGQAVTNEAVAAATPLVKSCCCCKNSSKCKGGGRHLLQFELECSIYKVGRYHSTEAIVILLKSVRIGGAHVLFSLALYVCNWYILQFLPPLKHNSQFTPALLISRPKVSGAMWWWRCECQLHNLFDVFSWECNRRCRQQQQIDSTAMAHISSST